ncbi:MAG: DEAD/DEAH box helicase, partial [Treponema sp.]|nr:DEAD/DEAH box helicase [Treponema sp.]
AMQTCTEMASFTTGRCPRTAVVYGGASMGEQMRSLRRGVEIVVGTPGRVQDLMDRGVLDISKIDYFILDEGDEMLDMGFVDDIENIFSAANPDCRVLLFSATVPQPILKIAQKFMGDYEIVEEEGHEEEPLLIEQKYWLLRQNEKIEALVRLIDISPDFYGLVFVQRKSDADMLNKVLDEKGYQVAALHGDIPQGQREKILARFRAKKTRILVATDVAARGIDIGGLTHVINYELPFDAATYVHRIGRTGRAGAEGMAVTFVRPEEARRKLNFLRNAVKRMAKGEMQEGTIPSIEEVLNAKKQRLFEEVKEQIGLGEHDAEAKKADEDDDSEKTIGEQWKEGAEASAEEKSTPHLRKGDPIFDKLAEEICSGQNPQDVVASLLAATYGKELSVKRYSKIGTSLAGRADRDRGERGGRERERGGRDRDRGFRGGRERDGIAVSENQIRLFVQLGWKDRYDPRRVAEFFSDLVGVQNRQVDDIDMAERFCLVTLPKEAGERALDLSKMDTSLPHMHVDSKSVQGGDSYGDDFGGRGGRSRRGRRGGRDRDRDGGFGRERRFGGDRYAVARGDDDDWGRSDRGRGFSSRAKGGSHTRPGIHTATQRSGGGMAALYKKGGADEY